MAKENVAIPNDLQFKAGLAVAGLEAFAAIALAATSGYLISRAAEMPPIMYLMVAVVGVRAFALTRAASRYFQRLFLHNSVFRRLSDLRPKLFEKVSELTPSIGGRSKSKDLGRLTFDVDELENLGLRILAPLVQIATALIFLTLLIGYSFPLAGLVAGILSIGYLVLITFVSKKASEGAELEKASVRSELGISITDYLLNIDLLNAYGWSNEHRATISNLGNLQIMLQRVTARTLGLSSSLSGLGAILVAVVAGLVAALSVQSGAPGNVLAVAILAPLAAFEIFAGVQGVVGARAIYSQSTARVNAILDQAQTHEQILNSGESTLKNFESLQLTKINIKRGGELVLRDFDLEISKSSFIAITGPSGSGKSSLAYVLTSLISASSGEFLINGNPADSFSLQGRRTGILLVEQQPHVFAGAVRQNLEISGENSDLAMIKALKRVALWQVFEPRGGLDALLSEDASNVSGGEAQRLAIARGLLAKSNVLVLDEPTSGLDQDNASALIALLRELCSDGIAVVLITHDLELAKLADRIIDLGNRG
ncbi:MAG: thiol reductant ABC exporter subunit CydC [Aquiluna sp.]|nr:thiol reductant ABC exporter subunit CydC [Aquiluna sp.]MCF8545196.1 thiol reductant ABC exporter subunit CydC [Aquiluna sp.]